MDWEGGKGWGRNKLETSEIIVMRTDGDLGQRDGCEEIRNDWILFSLSVSINLV